ncbi:Vegetative incompatibility protein HET-E-1-like [Oopsacas minuta]|uniref:Vegetative incompatibility protein HET-E-1-like n=1 Tax=Oopsacas minuta TaxID=111878 RepID=A0AAV7KHZ2_9METZ|nr:Vegetative incompatibility protein HET-E-1-like [Oopsacas minuta]
MGGKDSKPFSGKLYRILVGHSAAVTSVSFSPNNRYIATCSADQSAILWDLRTFNPIRTLHGHSQEVTGCCFSHDSKMLVTCSNDRTLRTWRIDSGEAHRLSSHTKVVTHVTCHPSTMKIVSSSADRLVILWDLTEGKLSKKKMTGHKDTVYQAHFSPDGVLIASCSADRSIILWSASSGKQVLSIKDGGSQIMSCPFSPDGTLLACMVDGGRVRVWNHIHTHVVNTLKASETLSVRACAFLPDNNRIVTGSADRCIMLWTAREDRSTPLMLIQEAHAAEITSVQFSSNGKFLASSSLDEQVKIWV